MSRPMLFIGMLVAGLQLFSHAGIAEESTSPATAGKDAAPDADEMAALKVQIVAAARTNFHDSSFVGISCEATNPSKVPMMFVGYRSDSFDPPLERGQFSPIYIVELQRGEKWEKHPIGWCGTGIDGIELPAEENGTFGLSVLVDPAWTAVRVGVRWSRPLDFSTAEADAFTIAWSDPLTLEEIDEAKWEKGTRKGTVEPRKEEVLSPSKTGAITHGQPEGHFAAFLIADRKQWKVGEPISLSHGLICVSLPPAEGDGKRVWSLKVLKPYPAADPGNRSWFTVTVPDGKELAYRGEFLHWPAVVPEDDILLGQGEFVGRTSSEVELEFDLKKPGRYRFRWHHSVPKAEIVSNEVEIEIVP